MITQCPACATHFRLHADQLAARAGQVRCGRCDRVFNALEHLVEAEPEPVIEPAAIAAAPQRVEPAPETAGREPIGRELAAAPEHGAPGASFDFGPAGAAALAARTRLWPWLLGSLLLFAALAAQAVYHYRTAISLLIPETKPWLVQACAALDCDLPLPRRIELMSIEASDLQADTTNPSVMVLSATLKNRAVFNQQYPLIELTLTDSQDQPVVRRVLAPQDYMGKALGSQTAFAANTEVAIKVFVEGAQVKATGYRLYLFYS